jgi:hypothetical protein
VILASCFAGIVGTLLTAAGTKPPVNARRGDVAVQGYDVVAYTTGAAVRGTPEFEHRWNGARWQFASAANRDRFAASPETHAPQFGGYCAWAVSRGYTADIDPGAFSVVNGKLYLNYSKSVRRQWERDVPGNISRAEANWPGVLTR